MCKKKFIMGCWRITCTLHSENEVINGTVVTDCLTYYDWTELDILYKNYFVNEYTIDLKNMSNDRISS